MKHLFVLCGNGGGSSLLKHIIEQCDNVACFEKEGESAWEQYGPGGHTMNQRKKPHQLLFNVFEDPNNYKWGMIKSRWSNLWKKKEDGRVYFQKSTADYIRWKMLIQEFENVHFLIMVRNPFAHIEGMIRKCAWPISCEEMTQGWINMFERQMECHREYEHTTLFTFEQLCFEESIVEDKIRNLMPPELQDVNVQDVVFKHNHRDDPSPSCDGIVFNVRSIYDLTLRQIYTIKKLLTPYEDQLNELGYFL